MVKSIDNNSFTAEVLDAQIPVLVDFYADWCGPCKMMAPIVEQVADQLGNTASICKLNVDQAQDLAQKYGVMSIPTLIVFKNGEEVEKIVGATSKESLVELLNKHM